MDTSKLRRYLREVTTKRTGPNDDANRVVWAISTCFFCLSCFFIYSFLSTTNIGATMLRRGSGKATTRRTGPNDVNRVVWAISKCFFFSCFYIYILNHFYRFYDNVEVRMDTQEGTTRKTSINDVNRVVWAISMCFLFSFRIFFFTILYLQVLQVLWSYGSTYRKLQREERAQTNAYHVVWAIRKFFLLLYMFFYIY